jgi:hypothetical protein
VKNSILLPAFFLFYFLIFFIFLTTISVFSLVISNHVDIHQVSSQQVFSYTIFSMIEVLPGAILFSFLILFFRILKRPGNRMLSYLFIIVTATIVLAGGITGIQLIDSREIFDTVHPAHLMSEGQFNRINDNMLYIGEIRESEENTMLLDNLLMDISNTKKNQKLYYANKGYINEKNGKIEVVFSGNVRKKIIFEPDLLKTRHLPMDFFTRELLSSYNIFIKDLRTYAARGGIPFFLLCLASSFLFMTTNVFIRISKWPLFNFVFLFFILTGVFFLYKLYNTIVMAELVKLLNNSFLVSLIPVMGIAVLGIFFFLFDVIFIPFNLDNEDSISE